MKNYLRQFAAAFYTFIMFEFNFIKRLIIRILELIGQCFPEDTRGCKIRGLIYRPFLKKCGRNFQVGLGAKLEHPGNIVVGNDVYIGHGCWISGIRGGIILEDEVMLGPFVKMVSSNHTKLNNSYRFGPGIPGKIRIGRGSWIAANAVLTAGVAIGECCLIAAGSVVTKNQEAFTIVGGVPAKRLKFDFEK